MTTESAIWEQPRPETRFHTHENLKCIKCGTVVYPKASCATSKEPCVLPSVMLCRPCQEVDSC